VSGVGERPEHGAHEVPVALARDRFHGQHPHAFNRRRRPRAGRHQ